jgi:PAS domain S-box-containing protein
METGSQLTKDEGRSRSSSKSGKSSKFTIGSSLLLGGATVCCLFFWIQSQSLNVDQHSQYLTHLRQMQELDAQINQGVLLAKDGLLTYYDPIVQKIIELEQLRVELEQFPAFIGSQEQQELEQLLQIQVETWRKKESLIQQFLSHNAVLRNSLSYLPVSVETVIEQGRMNPVLASQLNSLLRNILLFNLSNDEELAPQINQEMEQLLATPDLVESKADLENTIAHAQQILRNRPMVGRLVNQIMTLPTNGQSEAIVQTYDRYYKQALQTSNTYRLGFYLLSTTLLIGVATNIISRLRASALVIQQNEIKFRNIFENSQVGIFRTRTEDGLILDANQQFATMLGFNSADEIVGHRRSAEFYVNLSDRQRAVNILRTHGAIHNFETEFHRQDGSKFWILYSARENAAEGYMEGVVADISDRKWAEDERKQAEIALKASEAELRSLFAAMTEVILVYDRDGRCLKLVSTNPNLLIKPSDEQVGHTVYEALPKEQAEIHHRHILQVLETKQTLTVEYSLWIGDRQRWSAASVSPLSEDTVLWVARDITDLKEAETALRQSEATNRALINAIPDLLLRVQSDGTYLDVLHSNQFQVINRNRLLVGTTVYDSLPSDRAQERMYYIEQALKTRELQVYEQEIVFDGEPHVEEVRVMASRDNEAVIMVRDITDRKQAEELLRQSVEAAEAANRAKSVFLANMSHELRTPLNVILGFTQLMIRGGSLNSQQQEQLNTINRSGEHLLTLINDVLEMSKIEAGRVTLNESDFDLHSLLDWLYQMFQIKAQSKGLRLTFEQTNDLPNYIRTDETKLRQVLVNLVGNAVKFTSKGGVTLRVSWLPNQHFEKASEKNHEKNDSSPNGNGYPTTKELITVQFAVEDTGPGIAEQELDRLFKPFVQTDTGYKSQEGTGLGLAISQKFAQLMGGEITVCSTLGSGSTFQFQIEAEAVESGKLLPSTADRQVIGLAAGQEQYRILVVEDKPENRQILRELLVPVGFEVQEAVNGAEGIVQWQVGQPHLIWMDIRMPIMDGYEATQQIETACREQGLQPPIIIALTGSVFEEDRQIALSVGCNDFVRKPFRAEEIFEKMTEYLGVQYVYADNSLRTTHHSSPQTGESALSTVAANLAAMPSEWVKQLYQAAANVNSKLVLKLIEEIPEEHQALAIALTQLVDDFCFEEIVELAQQPG